jgi:hypothetical protein
MATATSFQEPWWMAPRVAGMASVPPAFVLVLTFVSLFNLVALALIWFQLNPQYGWPIVIIVGLLLLSCAYSILRCCCCPKKTPIPVVRNRQSAPSHSNTAAARQSAAPPTWVDPTAYNGANFTEDPIPGEDSIYGNRRHGNSSSVQPAEYADEPGKLLQFAPGKFIHVGRSNSASSQQRSPAPAVRGQERANRASHIPAAPQRAQYVDRRVSIDRIQAIRPASSAYPGSSGSEQRNIVEVSPGVYVYDNTNSTSSVRGKRI